MRFFLYSIANASADNDVAGGYDAASGTEAPRGFESVFGQWSWSEILLELFLVALLATLAYAVLSGFNRFVNRVYRGRGRWRSFVLRAAPLVRFGVFAVLLVAIGTIVFRLSTPVLGLTLFALALALGLASVDLVRNVISGALIGFQRPFRVNDRIRLGDDIAGDVQRIGIRSTSLRATDGRLIHVPNQKFISDVIVNATLDTVGTPAVMTIPLPVGVDIAEAKQIAFRAACVSKFASPRRRPNVRVTHNLEHIASTAGGEPPLALEVQVYAFDARYEEQLRGEIIEIVGEGVMPLLRDDNDADTE